jgi:hypothetical protein
MSQDQNKIGYKLMIPHVHKEDKSLLYFSSPQANWQKHSKSDDIDLKGEFMPLCHHLYPMIKIDMKRSFNGYFGTIV